MEKIEILDNREMWDAEPCAAAEVVARFEELDRQKGFRYSCRMPAGVGTGESPELFL